MAAAARDIPQFGDSENTKKRKQELTIRTIHFAQRVDRVARIARQYRENQSNWLLDAPIGRKLPAGTFPNETEDERRLRRAEERQQAPEEAPDELVTPGAKERIGVRPASLDDQATDPRIVADAGRYDNTPLPSEIADYTGENGVILARQDKDLFFLRLEDWRRSTMFQLGSEGQKLILADRLFEDHENRAGQIAHSERNGLYQHRSLLNMEHQSHVPALQTTEDRSQERGPMFHPTGNRPQEFYCVPPPEELTAAQFWVRSSAPEERKLAARVNAECCGCVLRKVWAVGEGDEQAGLDPTNKPLAVCVSSACDGQSALAHWTCEDCSFDVLEYGRICTCCARKFLRQRLKTRADPTRREDRLLDEPDGAVDYEKVAAWTYEDTDVLYQAPKAALTEEVVRTLKEGGWKNPRDTATAGNSPPGTPGLLSWPKAGEKDKNPSEEDRQRQLRQEYREEAERAYAAQDYERAENFARKAGDWQLGTIKGWEAGGATASTETAQQKADGSLDGADPEWTSNLKDSVLWERRNPRGVEMFDSHSGLTRNREALGRQAHASVLEKAVVEVPLCRTQKKAREEQTEPEETGLEN